jgi:TonB-dependent receptor
MQAHTISEPNPSGSGGFMLSSVLRVFCLVVILTVLLTSADAQMARSAVAGRVTDSSGAVLPGAKVELQPSGLSVVSDANGQFTITNVVPGDYTLTVNYVGFAAYSQQLTLTAGQVSRVSAAMKVASANEIIVVTSERGHGEAAAINEQRESDNILQVLPVEVITSLPNTNIADAVGRLPSVTLERDEGEGKYIQVRGAEPRYNNVTIDGVEVAAPEAGVRQIKLDTMPANLIESVEVNKTLSANEDGDAIGGSVNLKTKAAERPTFYINGIGGYTPISGGRPLVEMDSYVGQRFGESKKLGILIGASYDWNGRGINDVEPVPVPVGCGGGQCLDFTADPSAQAPYLSSYNTEDLRNYRYYRTRYGFTANIDYKLSDISGVYIRTLYSHFDNFGDRWVFSPTVGTFQSATLTNADGTTFYNSSSRRPIDVIGSLQVGGKHELSPKWLLVWDAAVSRSSETNEGYLSINFNGSGPAFQDASGNPLLQYAINLNDHHVPNFTAQNGVNLFDLSQYSLNQFDIDHSYSPQINLEGGFSAARNYNWKGHFGTLEFGGKFRNAHKFQDTIDPVYTPNNTLLASNFLGTATNPTYYDGAFPAAFTGPQFDDGKFMSAFNANPGAYTIDEAGSVLNSYSNDWDIVERVGAWYGMNTLQFGRVRIQTGLRFEETTENLYAYNVGGGQTLPDGSTAPPTFAPISRYHTYLDPLPSAQVKFQVGKDSAIRVSYGRGIARPNFGDLPPAFGVNSIQPGVPGQVITYGNPDLKPTHSNNIDVLFEQYLRPLGVIEGGFFYKNISDPIYEGVKSPITAATAQQNPLLTPYVNDILAAPVQGTNAHLWGFEMSYQQHLTFLPGLLNGFGLSANYSYTNSTALGIPLRTDQPALQRQAPRTGNFSPTYDKGRLSARLGVSYNGPQIFQYAYQNQTVTLNGNNQPVVAAVPVPLGVKGPLGDTYLYQHTQVDAQVAFRMHKGLQFIFAGLNLTNEVFGFYNGSPQYPIQREYYKPSYEFGLRYTLASENK